MKEMSNMAGKTQCKKPRLNGKAKAKRLSEESYDTAYREYQKKGEILFSEGMRNGKQYGEELIERVKKITRSFVKEEKVSPAAFLDDDYYSIVTALKLPAALHYNDFEYVGKGGDYDNGQFVRVEEWCCCELTCLREGIIHALADLCLQGATCAKKNSSINAKDAFINAYISIMCGCIKPDISEANLSKEEADIFVKVSQFVLRQDEYFIYDNTDEMRKFGIRYQDIHKLTEIGLIQAGTFVHKTYKAFPDRDNRIGFKYANYVIIITI
jgi:hypothetical protein